MEPAAKRRIARGRPPKFAESRRPVTVTLPERTLRLLAAVDSDRARAIVKVTDAAAGSAGAGGGQVELVEIEPGVAVIIVGPSRCLKRIPWLRLVEIAPARYLLSIPSGMALESLEVAIADELEALRPDDDRERALLETLLRQIGSLRREKRMTKSEIIFVSV